MEITLSEAKNIVVNSQLLSGNNNQIDSGHIIRHLGYVQIDTISVIERSHHHVLFSRNNAYSQNELDALVANQSIFEYWSHAAAYLPVCDYKYSLFQKTEFRNGKRHWYNVDKKVKNSVFEIIKKEGPKMSRDFDHPKSGQSDWYQPKPIKMALNQLFIEGQLMVSERKGFQKVYDLPERCLPSKIHQSTIPDEKEFYKYLIENAIKANGLVKPNEITYLRKGIQHSIKKTLAEMLENKEVIKVNVLEEEYFAKQKYLDSIDATKSAKMAVHFLSPFDNLIIQRKRLKEIFGMDYQLECYCPKAKRKYGYFVLPVLYGENFVARMDSKADRKSNTFNVFALFFEKGFVPDDEFISAFKTKLRQLATFNNCESISIGKVTPAKYKRLVRS